jgi:dihydrofolate reductase
MADLIYAAIASLDGYVADERGEFDWAAPDEEVHAYVNALERPVGTYLYGRRMYDTMVFWETEGDGDDEPAVMHEYTGIWRAADKVVFSRTLDSPSSAHTRIEREFDPVAVRALVDAAARDVSIGGAEIAGQALAAGVVDQVHLIVVPVIVGGGTRALPDGVRLDLELVGDHRFASGFVHLHYRVVSSAAG